MPLAATVTLAVCVFLSAEVAIATGESEPIVAVHVAALSVVAATATGDLTGWVGEVIEIARLQRSEPLYIASVKVWLQQ